MERLLSRPSAARRALLPAVLMAAAPALAAAQSPRVVDLVIASTTDVHGRIRGWDYFGDTAETARGLSRAATVVDSVRSANPGRVILVDAGDLLQGNPLTYVAHRESTKPHAVIAAMNTMKYDAAAVGNHEFNYGVPALDRALKQARFPFLAANARRLKGKPTWSPFTIVERDGVKVGIVGATTPGAMTWDRANLLGRVEVGDIVTALKSAVPAARRAGAQVVVVVAHAGLDGVASYDTVTSKLGSENPMAQVARVVPGIDLIVFGHSHRELADTVINGVLLTQPRNWAASVSVAHLLVRVDGAVASVQSKRATVVRVAGHAEQPAVVAIANRAHEAARRYANTVIGTTATSWRADSARVVDLPIMDFVAETMRSAAKSDLASVAAFSLDVKIPAGNVTVAQMAQLYPYDNTLRSLRVTGAQLRAFLEQSAKYFVVTGTGSDATVKPDPAIPGFNFEIVTGATYAIDLSRPIGSRITGLAVRGKPVNDADSFTIALSNYRAGGAGNYSMLRNAPAVHDKQLEIRQLLIDEIARRKTLVTANYFKQNWSLLPVELAAKAAAAIRRERPFDAVSGGETRAPAAPGATGASGSTAAKATTIRIIGTNDFHGALEARPDGNFGLRGGAGQVAAMIKQAQAECGVGCASLLVDGGDMFQGTPASNIAFGLPVVQFYDALGYAAAAIGNHEFDWGQDTLRARMKQARFAFLAANVRYKDGRTVPWIRADTIVERGGVKIGIIGLASVITPSTTKATNVADLQFLPGAPVVDAQARSLRARGAELVIVIAHDGGFCNPNVACSGQIFQMAQSVTEPIDAIVSGHSHSLVNTVINGIPITQARSSGRSISVIDLPVDRAKRAEGRREIRTVVTDSIVPDPATDALAKAAIQRVAAMVARPIATVQEDMMRTGSQYALGNFIADAQRAAASADIAIMNNSGIRQSLRAGPASYGTLFEVQPFGNILQKFAVRGRDLKSYFESLVTRDEPRAHISGAIIRFDRSKPAGARIVSVTIAGAPLDESKVYTVAFNDFIASGTEGLRVTAAAVWQAPVDLADLDALIAFASAQPGGLIKPDAVPRIVAVTP